METAVSSHDSQSYAGALTSVLPHAVVKVCAQADQNKMG